MTPSKQHNHLAFIDAMRGIAAFSVFLFHANNQLGPAINLPIHLGQFGVIIFFLLSGYVIPISLERSTPTNFWVRRFFRLYPAYWFSIAVLAVLAWFHIPSGMVERFAISPVSLIAANITMFQSLIIGPDFSNNLMPGYWTLLVEMLFYIIITILAILRILPRTVSIAVSFLVLALFVEGLQPAYDYEPARTVLYLAVMMTGMVLFRFNQGTVSRRATIAMCVLCEIVLVLIPAAPDIRVARALVLPSFVGLLWWRPSWRPLCALGTISYSFYLLHGLPIEIIQTNNVWLNLLLWLITGILAAAFAYVVIERPAINAGRALLRKRSNPTPAAPEAAPALSSTNEVL